jgi:hypothetical protein
MHVFSTEQWKVRELYIQAKSCLALEVLSILCNTIHINIQYEPRVILPETLLKTQDFCSIRLPAQGMIYP